MPPRGRDQRCRSGRALSQSVVRSGDRSHRGIEDLVDEFLAIKATEGKRRSPERPPPETKDFRVESRRGPAGRGVTTCDIGTWLTGLAVQAQARMNYRTTVNDFFRFAVARGYASSNPVAAATKFRVPVKVPGILNPSQVRALLSVRSTSEILAPVVWAHWSRYRKEAWHARVRPPSNYRGARGRPLGSLVLS